MAMQEAQAEPSMEEILASIRRIISEEDQAPAAPAEVLELTQPAEDVEDDIVFEDTKAEAPPVAAPPPAAPPMAAAPAPQPAPPPQPRVAPAPTPAPQAPTDTIVSEPAAYVTADAFSRLAGSVRVADSPNQTLEGLIRQLVRPMLKEWLDAHLPSIVEAKVEAELDRISRLSR
jgi:cell pole-organizing protein PopZ